MWGCELLVVSPSIGAGTARALAAEPMVSTQPELALAATGFTVALSASTATPAVGASVALTADPAPVPSPVGPSTESLIVVVRPATPRPAQPGTIRAPAPGPAQGPPLALVAGCLLVLALLAAGFWSRRQVLTIRKK